MRGFLLALARTELSICAHIQELMEFFLFQYMAAHKYEREYVCGGGWSLANSIKDQWHIVYR